VWQVIRLCIRTQLTCTRLGFYVDSPLLPAPTLVRANATSSPPAETLLLGPFCGKPACQLIRYKSGKSRGVCADAYIQRRTLLVADVEAYPGHIACDGETKSEVVVPLLVRPDGSAAEFGDKTAHAVGVLDLDCLALGGFDEQDKVGLEKIAQLIVASCDW
jgi:L-methionine (R)-S-oxide reductase